MPPPWGRPTSGPKGHDAPDRVAAPPASRVPTLLYVALGVCAASMLVMLGVIIHLARDRDRLDARLADADTPAAPSPSSSPDPGPGATATVVGPDVGAAEAGPDLASLLGQALGGAAEAVAIGPGAGAGSVEPVEPAEAEVEPVALPGRVLSTAEIVETCEPSVALIEGAISSGTGFLAAPGLLVTNAHVIESELVGTLAVRFPSAGDEHAGPHPAELVWEAPARDLALLRVPSRLPPLAIAREHRYVKGEDVTVIGNPGVGPSMILENAVSKGVMSTRATIDGQPYIQLGIAINPGNSGGPVFDARGEVIGVATLKTAEQEAMGFCIPVEDLRRALDQVDGLPATAPAEAEARHRPSAMFHLLTTAGALHAVGLDRHVIAWNDARGGTIRQLIARDPELKELRDGLDGLHEAFGPQLDDEGDRLRDDPDVPNDVKDGLTRLASNYVRFRQLLARPPDDFDTLLRRVSTAEATHRDLVRSVGDRLGIEVEESLLAALEPLQAEGPPPGDDAGRILLITPDRPGAFPPGFDRFGGRFGFPSIPRPPGMGPRSGRFGPGFP